MTSEVSLNATVPADAMGRRFDQVAAELFPDFSRSRIQAWIRDGDLKVDGRTVKPNTRLAGGESLTLLASLDSEESWEAQDIDFPVVFQDEAIIVIDKPAGMVVHPAAGNWSGTLLNGLLYRYPELAAVPRAGIVHRLDKDTSGLMVVARTLESQNKLVQQLQSRTVTREYQAVVHGVCEPEGVVDQPIGRHPSVRTKMAVVAQGKPALTQFRRLAATDTFSHISLRLATGRTHQIRVHMAYIGLPLVGDPVYGKRVSGQGGSASREAAISFERQALHAVCLGLQHPIKQSYCEWYSELPADFVELVRLLQFDRPD